ncbi:hypothetical protein L9F63_009986, partial [Diploptera punctata]
CPHRKNQVLSDRPCWRLMCGMLHRLVGNIPWRVPGHPVDLQTVTISVKLRFFRSTLFDIPVSLIVSCVICSLPPACLSKYTDSFSTAILIFLV